MTGRQYDHNRELRSCMKCRMMDALEEAGWSYVRDDECMARGWVDPAGTGFMTIDRAYNVLLGISEIENKLPEYREYHRKMVEDFCGIMRGFGKTSAGILSC